MMMMTMTLMIMSKVTKAQSGSWERRPWGERPTELDASSDWVRFEIARKISFCFFGFSSFLIEWDSKLPKKSVFCFFLQFFFLLDWVRYEIGNQPFFIFIWKSECLDCIFIRWEPAVRPTMARRQSTIGVIVDSEFRVSRTSPHSQGNPLKHLGKGRSA